MGKIFGTCGHELKSIDDNILHVKEYDQGKRVVAQICVCDECAKWWEERGYVLEDEKAERKWLEEDK